MPAGPRPRRESTDEWDQLRLLVASPAQETYELPRPIVLFGQPIPARTRETAVPERTLRRKVARFAAHSMRSLFDIDALAPPTTARRLVQYPVAFGADGRRLWEVGKPRLYTTGHASPQPFLPPLDETE